MALPRPSTPRAVLQDLRRFMDGGNRYKWLFGAISIMMPALLIAGFYVDSHVEPPPLGTIYVQSWPADRTDAQIVAQQKIDQAKRDKFMAEKRAGYQRLAKQLGIE